MRSKRFASLLVALVMVSAVLAGVSRVGYAGGTGTVAFSAATYAGGEALGFRTVSITVNFARGNNGAVDVGWTVTGGTAISPGDYAPSSGTLTWGGGTTGNQSFNVTIVDDIIVEGPEDVHLAFTTPPGTGVTLRGTIDTAVIDITDDDTANNPPAFTVNRAGDDYGYAENAAVSLACAATDPDLDPLAYSFDAAPAWLSINDTTGAVTGLVPWDAAEIAGGLYTVTVRCTDGTAPITETFTLTVTDTNRSPILDPIENQVTAEGPFVGGPAQGWDLDPEDTLTWSISGQPADIVIALLTGFISGAVGYEAFENQPAHGHYIVTVTVTDNHGASASQSFDWTVTDTNRPPTFTGAPTNTAQTIDEGAGLVALAATDPDLDTLTFTLTGGALPPGITLQVGGTFAGTANHGSEGIYSATIRVSDGSLTTTTVLDVTVAAEEEDEAPAPPRVGPPLKTGIVITVVPGSHTIWVSGYPHDLDAPAYFGTPGRMMVPLRFISETFGAEVLWNPVTQQITIRGDWTTIVLTVGSRTAFVNGVAVRLDAPAVLVNGRVFVPLRFICEALGAQVDYQPSTHSARIHW